MANYKKTVVNFVLDESGSMGGVRAATISGINEYLLTLRKQRGVLFTLTKFGGTRVTVMHKSAPIADVAPLNLDAYQPEGGTPLYDAIARTIRETESVLAGMRGKPNVLCVIMTDGEENSSREYDRDKLFALIKEKEALGWTFVYLGANQDAFAVGASIGIPMAASMNYNADQPMKGIAHLSSGTERYFSRASAGAALDANAAGFFEEDEEWKSQTGS